MFVNLTLGTHHEVISDVHLNIDPVSVKKFNYVIMCL
ncbi:hypothetical protein BVRB_012470 [Beta vulgaris subsp. vulgaris]|uniref:Uncharacterized protein n=1 Tax=Beta vulgaris subsp. vulgaris TaxID=3555 RepID=A0A0J8B5E1_BETVV|nr:hypothetical protein BVRB_012470 [Beta vulgaris subsp. vulgaris]